jgi:hypothetical protein
MPFNGDGPTVGTFTNLNSDQFDLQSSNSCRSFGSSGEGSDVTIIRVDRNTHDQITYLDMTFEFRCFQGQEPIRGRFQYHPYFPAPTAPCVMPATGPAILYDQRTTANPNTSIACFQYTVNAGGGTGYGPNSRVGFVNPTETSLFYSGLAGINAQNGTRLAVGTFPIVTAPTAVGVKLFGPCFFATSGSATVTAIERNASDVITSLDFTFQCTNPDGYFRGIARLPYL